MKDRDAIRRNEQIKSISRTLLQFGALLTGAVAVKVYDAQAISLETLSWLVGAGALIWIGLAILGLLESEDL